MPYRCNTHKNSAMCLQRPMIKVRVVAKGEHKHEKTHHCRDDLLKHRKCCVRWRRQRYRCIQCEIGLDFGHALSCYNRTTKKEAEGGVQQDKGSKTKPSNQSETFTELGLKTRLVLSMAEANQPLDLEPQSTPALALMLSGCVLDVTRKVSFGPGEVLGRDAGQRYVAQVPTEVLQLICSPELSPRLRHFATALYHKDRLTAVHSARVGYLAWRLGQTMQLASSRLGALALAAYLHDIGKLRLPSGLLQSPNALSLIQWQLMMKHPLAGRDLLEGTPLEALGPILEQHHERLDGSGYPHGLKGNDVSLEAYIVAVADTFDASTHTRPYQAVRSVDEALSEINRFSDVLYPAEVVQALNQVSKTLKL